MRVFVYPYTYKSQFLLYSLNRGVKISGVYTQPGWKYDRGLLQERGVRVYETWEMGNELEGCDGTLFFPDESLGLMGFRQMILDRMDLCMEKKKHVYCSMQLDEAQREHYRELSQAYGVSFVYLREKESDYGFGQTEELAACGTPVIYIGELCENAGAKELTANVSALMQERGYRVCTILDDPCAKLLGMEATPHFIRDEMRETEKVTWFSQYIKRIERERQPDLFIIQVPGSVSRYSNKVLSDFGVYHFYYSNALCPDMYFCAMPYNMCDSGMAEMVDSHVKVNYCYGLDGIYKTNLHLNIEAAFRDGYVDYIYLKQPYDNGAEKKLSCGIPVFNGWKDNVCGEICDMIEHTLSEETIEFL